ncbi:PAP2 superfamily protein [Clostridium homopropionicum DSM 5847]|uniref:PAP2 superfamily protein n=1 Tax=Clostridium homopropionicum DSM 5847 TaxID=1121318 RepID=A0A0L6Z8F5_9CLOT|nr:phosphatase PAP2 family protein [Clostridium homopropionicum]KOA19251.1 PAP2 superfamily protein [Clostridium homopropionicum DSM 5847]SFG18800.1 Membrane-associated phospholipid phosphatase [Clostridium homopropionicum]
MFYKIEKDKALVQILIYISLVLLFLMENNIIDGKYNIHSKIDVMIPFIPIFVLPYFSWFLFIAFTFIIFFTKSREDLLNTFRAINLDMIIAMIIYILFPNYQSLRPTAYAEDFFSQLVKLLQIGDSSSSVCPSLHVAISISLYLGIKNSVCFKNNSIVKFFTLILTILISISTVFIKQHSIVDVLAGIFLSFIVHIFVYRIYCNYELSKNNSDKESYIQSK